MMGLGCKASGLALAVGFIACSGSSFEQGTNGTGGTSSGGATSTGGVGGTSSGGTNSGGSSGTGGTRATGGSSGSSGSSGTGGSGTGGTTGTGGSSGASGTSGTGGSTCDPLSSTTTDVYVDQRYTGSTPTGTQSCPYPTILQGMSAAGTLPPSNSVTIHVAGASPPLVYNETSSVAVPANRTLLGDDGPTQTTINASGVCGAVTCAVMVDGGGVLDGFTVRSESGSGIVTAHSNTAPVARNVAAVGSKVVGILALGSAELGPNINASNNTGNGVQSPASASGTLHVVGTNNAFDSNGANGINVDGAAALNFEGGTASGNFQGIRLAGTSSTGGILHTITSLTAKNNTGPGGVVAYNGQTIKLRKSTLLANTGAGLLFTYALAGSGSLDLGTATDPGNNVFGGATTATNNRVVGLRLCGVPAASVVSGLGNSWAVCPPVETALACDAAISAYSDIAYGSSAVFATGPVVASTCSVGP